MQFGIDHVRRYFSGSSRVVERDDNDHDISVQTDGTQGPKCGDVTRHIMVIDGNTEALELGSATPGRQLGRALIAAADEADQMADNDRMTLSWAELSRASAPRMADANTYFTKSIAQQ